MDVRQLQELAGRLAAGEIDEQCFVGLLRPALREAEGVGRLDEHGLSLDLDRGRRCGYSEVIFGEGKTAEAIAQAMRLLVDRGEAALATRVSAAQAEVVRSELPAVAYNEVARTLRIDAADRPAVGHVAVITAGTTDLPVAEEARETLSWMGVDANLICDVGVAGPHRLPSRLAEFQDADAIVVAAGMEGALPSVVAGYVPCPVIAAPTSVGYGANFNGLAALLSMLNSCAANVAVVNIDAGFKAGYLAGMIAQRAHGRPPNAANSS